MAATTEATSSVRMVKAKILLAATEEGVEIAGEEAKITTAMADLRRKAHNTSTLQKTNGIILAKNSSSGANRPQIRKTRPHSEFGLSLIHI